MVIRLLLVVGLLFAVVHVLPFAGPREARPSKMIAANPETGHTYQIVWDHHATWHEARDRAKAMQCNGLPGHLATITSPEEQDFLVANLWNWHSGPLFIGASDADEEGVWKWVDGPEAGQVFFADGHCVNGFSERWCSNEPNNMGSDRDGGEDVAVWNWMSEAGWNDVAANNRQHGYLVEFSPPESAAPKKAPARRHTYLIRDLAAPPTVIAPAKSETDSAVPADAQAAENAAAKIETPVAAERPAEQPQSTPSARETPTTEPSSAEAPAVVPPANEVPAPAEPSAASVAEPPASGSVETPTTAEPAADQPAAETDSAEPASAESAAEPADSSEPAPEQPAQDAEAE
jgi:hypothetical protein